VPSKRRRATLRVKTHVTRSNSRSLSYCSPHSAHLASQQSVESRVTTSSSAAIDHEGRPLHFLELRSPPTLRCLCLTPQVPYPQFLHLVRDLFPHRVTPSLDESFVRDHASSSDSHTVSNRVTSTLPKWGPRWGPSRLANSLPNTYPEAGHPWWSLIDCRSAGLALPAFDFANRAKSSTESNPITEAETGIVREGAAWTFRTE
jgi:hypothetical protein